MSHSAYPELYKHHISPYISHQDHLQQLVERGDGFPTMYWCSLKENIEWNIEKLSENIDLVWENRKLYHFCAPLDDAQTLMPLSHPYTMKNQW